MKLSLRKITEMSTKKSEKFIPEWSEIKISAENDIEFASTEQIAEFQNERLQEAIAYAYVNSKFYKRLFDSNGISPQEIRTIADLQKLPFTTKTDLQLHNEDFLCVEPEKIVDYVTTSGTLGDPVTFGCTESDLNRLAYNEEKSFRTAGLKPGSIVQLMTTLDKRFMAGMAYFLGIRRIGASVIRVGNGIPKLQWDTILRLKPDTLMCVPSFILRLVEYAEQNNIDWRKSSIRRIIGIGEGLREQDFKLNLLGSKIKDKWNVELFATYSSTEMGATFAECAAANGGHIHPELIVVEIIGEDDKPVADGEYGEVTVTTLGVEGMPLVRFRTGDVCSKMTRKCACGRNSFRLTPILGRKNNMIKLKGTTLYPPAIFDVLDNADFVENYIVYVRTGDAGTDDVLVKVGLRANAPKDTVKVLKDLFRASIRVAPRVEIGDPAEIAAAVMPPHSRKPIKFIDLR